jgi:hypothetical protein
LVGRNLVVQPLGRVGQQIAMLVDGVQRWVGTSPHRAASACSSPVPPSTYNDMIYAASPAEIEQLVEATTDLVGEAWIADGVGPVEQEIVVIEHILALFSFDIRREQLLQLGFPGGAPGKRRAHDFFDRDEWTTISL